MEKMFKSLSATTDTGSKLEAWLEALATVSEASVTLLTRQNQGRADQTLQWQEIEEGIPLLQQMTSALEQADLNLAWSTSQWPEGDQVVGKSGEAMSQLRTLVGAGADGLEAGELVRRGLRTSQDRSSLRAAGKKWGTPWGDHWGQRKTNRARNRWKHGLGTGGMQARKTNKANWSGGKLLRRNWGGCGT
jgi:hypothetical protein